MSFLKPSTLNTWILLVALIARSIKGARGNTIANSNGTVHYQCNLDGTISGGDSLICDDRTTCKGSSINDCNNVDCDTEYSCADSTMTAVTNLDCSAQNACSNVTMANIIEVNCNTFSTCPDTNMSQITNLYCGPFACERSNMASITNLDCSNGACKKTAMAGITELSCRLPSSCQDSTITDTAKVDCFDDASCQRSELSNIGRVQCSGRQACSRATMTSISDLDCYFEGSCFETTINNVGKVNCGESDVESDVVQSCRGSSMKDVIDVHCQTNSCEQATMRNIKNLECLNVRSCNRLTLYDVETIYATNQGSQEMTVYGNTQYVVCEGVDACIGLKGTISGGNVLCSGINSCEVELEANCILSTGYGTNLINLNESQYMFGDSNTSSYPKFNAYGNCDANVVSRFCELHPDLDIDFIDSDGTLVWSTGGADGTPDCQDSDGDGIVDIVDNCPTIYNPDQDDTGFLCSFELSIENGTSILEGSISVKDDRTYKTAVDLANVLPPPPTLAIEAQLNEETNQLRITGAILESKASSAETIVDLTPLIYKAASVTPIPSTYYSVIALETTTTVRQSSKTSDDDDTDKSLGFLMLDDGYVHSIGVSLAHSLDSGDASKKKQDDDFYVQFGIEIERVGGSTVDTFSENDQVIRFDVDDGRRSAVTDFAENDAPGIPVFKGDMLKFVVQDHEIPSKKLEIVASMTAHLHIQMELQIPASPTIIV